MNEEALDWTEGAPRSRRFGDVYFSLVDGLAESRAVFLDGCGLPAAWAGRARFTVGELGFGTGLNILALIELWRRNRPPGAHLHVFSIEAFPLSREDAARALSAWPELAELSAALLERWPDGRRGMTRIDFPEAGVILDLAVMEAAEALEGWDGAADAWFLDGFAPARNPEMWRPELLEAVASRSASAARAATFTVAGAVRRGLSAAGFQVEKRAGFGRKRERLEAQAPDTGAAPVSAPARAAVIGAGIAGASLARALRARGVEVRVYDPGTGEGASHNPAALVAPRLDGGLGAVAALHGQAFARATALYALEAPAAIVASGALQLARTPRDPDRFARLAAWEGFAPGSMRPLTAEATAEALGEEASPAALHLRDALVIEPAPILRAWLGEDLVRGTVARLERLDRGWRLLDAEGKALGEAEAVFLAAGPASAGLAELPLQPVRGQVSWTQSPFDGLPAAWGGYAVPLRQGFLFGATHDRDDAGLDLRPADHRRNLDSLAKGRPRLAAQVEGEALEGRASLRAATRDHLPLAGAVPGLDGMFVLGGLGGRGFTLAPLLAEQVAALAVGAPRPLPRALAAVVDPARGSAARN